MKNNNEINIYWTPHSFPYSEVGDWNMLYEDPITLMDYWKGHLIKEEDEPSFISCPAFKNLAKNTYVFNNQPLFYLRFLTDKKINLKRFALTPNLDSYGKKCVDAKSYFGPRRPLDYLYEKFTKSRTRDLVLKEIKENLF